MLFDDPREAELVALRDEYLRLTREELPAAAEVAARAGRPWPIRDDHCFMRVVLDAVFAKRWDEVVDRRRGSAYRQLDADQLRQAIDVARSMLYEGVERVRTLDGRSRQLRDH